MIFKDRTTPRWLIFIIDIVISAVSLMVAYLLRFNFSIPESETAEFYYVFPFVLGCRAISFLLTKTYAGIIRYTSTKDSQRIFTVVVLVSIWFAIANIIRFYFVDAHFMVPFSVIIIDLMSTLFFMLTFRISVKVMYQELKNPTKEKRNVIIYGAGEAGLIAKRAIDRDAGSKYRVFAFIDDNKKVSGNKIERVPVYHTSRLPELLEKTAIENVIISIQNLSPDKKSEIVESCLPLKVNVLDVPAVANWINGELSFNQIKNIRIEDLLGRDPIELDSDKIEAQLKNKVILITGAAGSIGSELVRQISTFLPSKIILLDQAESQLYELELELKEKLGYKLCEVVIGDIRSEERVRNVLSTFKPDMIYHSAAYKHVPLMENNPSEAIRTNILGSKILVDLALEYGVKDFVLISTDKAVNPTNVMGATKRVAEIYAQTKNALGKTRFITTRFGNVLESNGSVIPLFRKQIEKGGPVTVTDRRVTRFFMTIREACQLVLEAGMMGEGGEIFIFDMGKSVEIFNLAKRMIRLSGLELGKDIHIKFIGLRPGEKLYEELLADEENTLPTHHNKIMIAKVREEDPEQVNYQINDLISMYHSQMNDDIVSKLKAIVPEYVSEQSEFAKLDQVKK